MKYKLIRKYPGLPKDWEVGMLFGIGDNNYNDYYQPIDLKYTNEYLKYKEVENEPNYFEKINYELITEEEYNKAFKGSDLDIDKTCDTCKFEDKTTEHIICSRCIHRYNKLKVVDDNWEAKELKFKVDEWYKGIYLSKFNHTYNTAFICYQKNESKCYGFAWDGNWTNHFGLTNGIDHQTWELADIKEVENLLIEKAKKDYPVGTKFRSASSGNIDNVVNTNYKILNNYIFSSTSRNIYSEGKWAEIIKEPKLTLGKYDVTLTKKYVLDLKPTCIWTNVGEVTFKKWLSWIDQINHYRNDPNTIVSELELNLENYKTILHLREDDDNHIGCIYNISWKQIDEITKAVKNE